MVAGSRFRDLRAVAEAVLIELDELPGAVSA
jgi:hypothetical protein